jgi:DNA polymerase III alpha subunit
VNYQAYHKHSFYSNVITPDSTMSPKDYALRTEELGQSLLSSVEHGWQGRYIEYYELAKEHNLKYIFGLESYFVYDRFEKDKTNAHLILLAKNENGRKNINRILSEANITGFYYKPRIDKELLFSLPPNDIWLTTACIAGLWKYDDNEKLILEIHDYFKDNFFLEVQNHNVESQQKLNLKIINLSNKYNIKTIFGTDSHFIYPNQSKSRDDYLLSKHIVYEDESNWYMDYPDYQEAFKRFEWQKALTNNQIAEAMDNTNIFLDVERYDSQIFCKDFKIPTLYPEKTQQEKNEILKNLVWSEWEKEKDFIDKRKTTTYEEEITKELATICDTNMADYFLLDREIVKRGKELGGHITMTGRGSAPSFYTSKLLGFTTIDRISASVKLFPERFITKERILESKSLPDIDFNLGNPEIFAQAQKEVLGEDHAYPMLAYGTMKPKAAWKLYARAKNIDFETANHISEQIDNYEMALKHLDEDEKDSINIIEFIDSEYHKFYFESIQYQGIVSDYKIHPCASLLYAQNIKEDIGLIKIKDNLCSCMDGLWAEKYGFLKNDLLKVSVVDLIYRTYERIGIQPHTLPELIKLCENNEKVWQIYKNAWAMGINQVEQTSTSGRVAKYAPKNISELAAFVAAVRPGFKSNYKQFEAREPFDYGIPSLDAIIQTKEFPYSYMIYQENVMQVMAYAGIPLSEGYDLIKNIAKKRSEKVYAYRERFLKNLTNKLVKSEKLLDVVATQVSQKIWKIIEDSAHYSFNAAHAYSYAGDSLYGAYLKSHYPFEFYETFLRMLEDDGDKDRLVKVKYEASKAFGIKFPPYRFGQDNRTIVAIPEKNEITSALASIKGFGSEIGNDLYDLSKKQYDTFLDFLIECEEDNKISKKFIDLINIRYFDNFGKNKKLLQFFEEFTKGKSRYSKKHSDKTKLKRLEELKQIWYNIPDENIGVVNQIIAEKEILGYITTIYPNISKRYVYVLEMDVKFAPRLQCYCLANGSQISLKVQRKIFDNNPILGGDILNINKFEKKPTVKYDNGLYIEIEGEYTWWISDFLIISPEEFNKIVQ